MTIIRRDDLFRPKKKSKTDETENVTTESEKVKSSIQSSTEKRSDRSVRSEKSEQSEQTTQTSVYD